ncbi:Putative auto-transporter adhesin, head GIN domain [Sphingobium faniae]|nr:Putative auto-transporter adhesin, head GIN domain [Sphingobium faniae]
MPRSLPLSALLLAGLCLTSACSKESGGNAASSGPRGAPAAQDWSTLKDFTAVEVVGPDDVAVTIGNGFAVKAEGDPNAIEKLEISVDDGRLKVGRKSQWVGATDKGATIRVTMPAIAAVTLTGSGDFDLDRAEGKALDLSLTGSGDMEIGAVKVGRLKADITGSGSLEIAGAADEGKLSLTGSGDIDGEKLKLGKADASLLGSGDIDFASDGAVAITITGPGNVTVKGKAQCKTSGIGPGEARCAP